MKAIKYLYISAVLILSSSLLYFPYYLKYRPQILLTNNIEKTDRLAKEFLVYEAENVSLIRHGKEGDGGYIVAEEAIKKADILLGYGMAGDNSFEDEFSLQYNKPSYGFDCGIRNIESRSDLFTFMPQCIGTSRAIYKNQKSSGQTSSFSEQISFLNLEDKKLFIKMDIERAEYDVFDDILKYSSQISGIVMELHILNESMIDDAINLLSNINRDFLLVHIHGNNCSKYYFSGSNIKGEMPSVIELTFINKNLVKNTRFAKSQKYPSNFDNPNCHIREENKFEILF
jgi:hypothetical protein